jgi:hypothetical protein
MAPTHCPVRREGAGEAGGEGNGEGEAGPPAPRKAGGRAGSDDFPAAILRRLVALDPAATCRLSGEAVQASGAGCAR